MIILHNVALSWFRSYIKYPASITDLLNSGVSGVRISFSSPRIVVQEYQAISNNITSTPVITYIRIIEYQYKSGMSPLNKFTCDYVMWTVSYHPRTVYDHPRPLYHYPRTVYYHPRPLYHYPRTVYYHPRTVYYHPRTVHYHPRSLYYHPRPLRQLNFTPLSAALCLVQLSQRMYTKDA